VNEGRDEKKVNGEVDRRDELSKVRLPNATGANALNCGGTLERSTLADFFDGVGKPQVEEGAAENAGKNRCSKADERSRVNKTSG